MSKLKKQKKMDNFLYSKIKNANLNKKDKDRVL